MKLLFAVLLIALASSGVLTLPARNSPQDDAEVVSVPQRRPVASDSSETDFHDFKGVIDTGSGYPFLQPNPSPFNIGFFNSFDDIFRRLRTRLWPLVDADDSEAGSGESPSETGFPLGFGLRTLTPLDTKNGNTTSTVKVVDGHRVEINETVYGDANNVFKVRLVNVRPLESGEEAVEGVTSNNGNSDNTADIEFRSGATPATSAPPKRSELDESDEDHREPLEKQPQENEVRDIDGPQV